MPRPQQWYDDFVGKLREKGVDVDSRGSADILHQYTAPQGNSKPSVENIDYAFDPDTRISSLTDAQKDKLFDLVEHGHLMIKDPKGGTFDYFGVNNDKDGNLEDIEDQETVTDLQENMGDKFYEMFPYYMAFEALEAKNNKGLNDVQKTLTDMYKDNKIEELSKNGLLTDGKGDPIPFPEGRGKKPYEKYSILLDQTNYQQGVYIQDLDKKNAVQIRTNREGKIEKNPVETIIVNKKVKDDAIKQLTAVMTRLKNVKTENANLKRLRENTKETIDALQRTARQDEFKKIIKDYAKDADMYYMGKVGAKMNKAGIEKFSIADKVRNIRDAVEKDVVPSEEVKGQFVSLQETLAAKYVRTYAATVAKHSKNPKMLEEAQKLQSDPEKFKEATKTAMESKTFATLFQGANEQESMKLMQDALNKKPSELFSMVQKEVEHPLAERNKEKAAEKKAQIEHNNIMKQKRPSITQGMKHGPVSPDMTEDISKLISQVKGGLDANSYIGKRSAEYEKLDHALTVAQIRLSRGNKFIDTRALMADVAKAAEGYQQKHKGEELTSHNSARMVGCDKLLRGFKAMDNDQLPSSVMPSDTEIQKGLIAQSIVDQSAQAMRVSNNRKLQEEGQKLLTNPALRDEKVQQLMESDAFKRVVGNDPAQIQKMMEANPEKLFNKVVTEQAKTDPKAAEKFKKEFGKEVKEPEKKPEVKPEDKITQLV